MPQESDAIRQEMDETRNSLTDKISQLEEKVVGTVNDATEGVKQTVEVMREAVQDTVQSVKDTVGETVDSVKESFSLKHQIEHRPWMVIAGGVGAGFLAGYFLNAPSPVRAQAERPRSAPRRTGNGAFNEPAAASFAEAPGTRSAEPKPLSAFAQLTKSFESEIGQVKGLAIGALAGIVRDFLTPVMPEMIRNPMTEVFNDITTKLGGQPIRGQVIPESWRAKPAEDADAERERTYRPNRQTSM